MGWASMSCWMHYVMPRSKPRAWNARPKAPANLGPVTFLHPACPLTRSCHAWNDVHPKLFKVPSIHGSVVPSFHSLRAGLCPGGRCLSSTLPSRGKGVRCQKGKLRPKSIGICWGTAEGRRSARNTAAELQCSPLATVETLLTPDKKRDSRSTEYEAGPFSCSLGGNSRCR